MHKQLLLFHNAIAAYFSGNEKALEATMKQFSIKIKTPNSTTPSWVEQWKIPFLVFPYVYPNNESSHTFTNWKQKEDWKHRFELLYVIKFKWLSTFLLFVCTTFYQKHLNQKCYQIQICLLSLIMTTM